jgi:hypothetical protein
MVLIPQVTRDKIDGSYKSLSLPRALRQVLTPGHKPFQRLSSTLEANYRKPLHLYGPESVNGKNTIKRFQFV